MNEAEIQKQISELPDDVLSRLTFSMPWQYDTESSNYKDPDGFNSELRFEDRDERKTTRDKLQNACWKKFNENPQINTSVRGLVGRLTGLGFETSSEIEDIQKVIEDIELDARNRLYNFWPKYVGRTYVEGELFLLFTCHKNGFIEVDFVDPASISNGGDNDSGIIFHPSKTVMPLVYLIDSPTGDGTTVNQKMQIPSIFLARYPELINVAKNGNGFDSKMINKNKSRIKAFQPFGGFYRFIVSWDRSFVTRRAVSYMRTVIGWLNHYENLKKYEIDHKKSSGAYVWVFRITEPKAFKLWLALSDEDRRKTGIASKKTPGGSLVLPPGIEVDVKSPNLPNISGADTDVLDMVASGLNEPEDVLMNRSKGTFASLKASRGPWNDRTSDEISYFERFLRFDFWDSIFFLKSNLDPNFKYEYKVRQAVRFGKDGEPVFENRIQRASLLLDITFPVSEGIDYEGRARGLMGVKHGPASETLGIPNSEISKRMGFGNYGRMRLKHATEKEKYPELIYAMDAESLQEQVEAEPKLKKKPSDKASDKDKKEE